MKSKYLLPFCIIAFLLKTNIAKSQVYMYPGPPRYYQPRPRPRPYRQPRLLLAHYDPVVELSVGYGFPNLDKTSMPEYYETYHNTPSQVGPFAGSLNYRFSHSTSIGLLVTHGTVNAPYYATNTNSATPAFNTRLDNWAFMLNLVNYLPGNNVVSPYIRLAIGVNSWQQDYTDAYGNKISMEPTNLPDLAYQVSLGAKFKLTKNSAFFVEAGYGKYIVEGGLTFKL